MLSGTVVKLSAIIITRNEAGNIGACLEGVAFCDERIVVDSGSDDDTVKIARAAGATVVTHAWAGFGAQKNFALSQARGEWVLSIDADERVSAPLAAEILSTIGSALANGYLAHAYLDPARPVWAPMWNIAINLAGPAPDYVYMTTEIDPAGIYQISGFRGTARFVEITQQRWEMIGGAEVRLPSVNRISRSIMCMPGVAMDAPETVRPL